ncbi:MAG: hypothetical protein IV100_17820 [Myxococcales bacterium]|nr:hypothetical protein [Myxococcales bacterium]
MLLQLALDVGGSIVFEPPEIGRPSAATVSIHSPAGTQLTAPSVTIDPVNTTLSSAASAGATTLSVASASNIAARRRYLVIDSDGEREWVRVRSISGTTVTLFDPIENALSSGSTFQGCRLTATAAAAACPVLDEGYEARWVYTIGSVESKAQTRFDVVRSPWPTVIGSSEGLKTYARHLVSPAREGGQGLGWLDDIEKATQMVRRDIMVRGLDPSRFRSFEAFEDVVYEKVILRLAESGDVVPRDWTGDTWLQERRNIYDAALSTAMQVTKSYDENQDGVTNSSERARRVDVVQILL